MTSLGTAAVEVLTTTDADQKAVNSIKFANLWQTGKLKAVCDTAPPGRPSRPDKPELLAPRNMPKRGKGGNDEMRIALLHAIAHIELNAIDLAWDIVARFGADLPKDFLDDWVSVAGDEARHFNLLQARLKDYGAGYGDFPAHDGLWQAAQDTSGNLLARLAIVPMVLEARGLDVTPGMIKRFNSQGDHETAAILTTIYEEEIGHVAAGTKWFDWACKRENLSPEKTWHGLVKTYFAGTLKPPFNHDARAKAGLEKGFYQPSNPDHPEKTL